jgi:hypothetical protein
MNMDMNLRGQSIVNVTWAGQNGELPDPISDAATDAEILGWVTEAVRSGSVPGIRADRAASFRDFIVDRFDPTVARPYRLVAVRPKTPFG